MGSVARTCSVIIVLHVESRLGDAALNKGAHSPFSDTYLPRISHFFSLAVLAIRLHIRLRISVFSRPRLTRTRLLRVSLVRRRRNGLPAIIAERGRRGRGLGPARRRLYYNL